MLKKLEIQNFQSHKNSVFDFSKGVNVIIGKTDSGKSAVIRAIKLVKDNRPSGDAFRSWNAKSDTVVGLSTYEGNTVTRTKGKENGYFLNSMPFKAFSTDVPEEIKKALNMDDTNIQYQLDAPFLLDNTPGEVAQYFNKIAHLDAIDAGVRNIRKEIKTINDDIKRHNANIKDDENKLKELEYIPKMEVEVEELESRMAKLEKTHNKSKSLEKLITGLEIVGVQKAKYKKWLKIEQIVTKLTDQYSALHKLQSDKKRLLNTITKAVAIKADLHYYKQVTKLETLSEQILEKLKQKDELVQQQDLLLKDINALKEVRVLVKKQKQKTKHKQTVQHLIEKFEELTTQEEDLDRFQRAIKAVKAVQQKLKTEKEDLEKLEKKFERDFPDVCPLCGTVKNHRHA